MPARVIDTLRSGAAPEVIRRKGAAGALPVTPAESIEILVFLSADPVEEIRALAARTLQSWNADELKQLLSAATTPPDVLKHLADRVAPGRPDLMEALLQNEAAPSGIIESFPEASEQATPEPTESPEASEEGKPGKERQTLLQRIGAMTPAQKIKTALTGNQEERLLLVRDSNKLVARAVLQSPKLSDGEIEAYATMKNVTEEVLRLIAMNRAFMKNYAVARALLNNPRSPLDITLPLLVRMNERDLKGLSLNKNVPETLRGMAQKLIKQRQDAQKSKIPTGKH